MNETKLSAHDRHWTLPKAYEANREVREDRFRAGHQFRRHPLSARLDGTKVQWTDGPIKRRVARNVGTRLGFRRRAAVLFVGLAAYPRRLTGAK